MGTQIRRFNRRIDPTLAIFDLESSDFDEISHANTSEAGKELLDARFEIRRSRVRIWASIIGIDRKVIVREHMKEFTSNLTQRDS